MRVDNGQQVPVNVVGSSTFGRYPKISLEKTYNMFVSDEWLVNYAGFQKSAQVLPAGEGRALFHSIRGQFLISVESSTVYKIQANLSPQFIGNLATTSGEVFIDENLSSQICIVDGQAAYIYNYIDNTLTQQTLTFLGSPIIPNYVCYHNTFFLIGSAIGSINSQNWYAFQYESADTISLNTQFSLQTKPDTAIAVKRIPGRGNNVVVFGTTVAEVWTQVGDIENYRRVQSFNIDSGCVNVATIAANEEFVCWLAQNENNAPSIFVTNGASVQRISSDGIDYLLQTIVHPEDSTAFFFRQDGHLFYQLTFFNTDDNVSLVYDFTTQKFFHVSDQNLNFHPARQVVYFNENTYFVSLNDASIYQMGTDRVTYNYSLDTTLPGDVIPRIRICKSIRLDNSARFRVGQFTFWIEQGVTNFYLIKPTGTVCEGLLITESNNYQIVSEQLIPLLSESGSCVSVFDIPRVDMSFSKNGNQSFSNVVGANLNPRGRYQNQIRWERLGQANEFTVQLRFWGFQRFVAKDGVAEIIV
ncbi:hypothetical protein UFOVP93_5 [uncultured Caudovirales phage]|uniref:Bacteriophage P22, Gp10, DNA-stabilising n=1 Tax=uncultured Caudovirales phage TaxID=2100421 RepID=A0A6J5L343_9CAUD|nr:hypothetical protein UFOVP93_5 [uncultured Caudovirales phage]